MALNHTGGFPSAAASAHQMEHPATDISNLQSLLPWEWVLEYLLDLRKLSLPFVKALIDRIPHIEDHRCSRLLQKVALRYLAEAVVTRKVDACAIPLISFILTERGVSDLHSIHSLKESFQNDLMFRIETEAVLTNLRCQSVEGGRDWEAYEYALENVFSEETCEVSSEPRRYDRRKELLALSSDRFKSEPERDVCEEVLAKYPLEELLRDIANFVEDQNKFFKTKFLDQLAKDLDDGVYGVQSMLAPETPGLCIPGTEEDISPHRQVSVECPVGPASSKPRNLKENDSSSPKFESDKVVPEIIHDGRDPVVDVQNDRDTIGTNSLPCKHSIWIATHEDKEHDGQKQVSERLVFVAKVSRQEDVQEGIDKAADQFANERTALVNHRQNYTGNVNKAECSHNFTSVENDDTMVQDPVSNQQCSVVENSASRAEVGMDQSDEPADHHVGEEGSLGTTTNKKNVDKGVKRVSETTLEQVTGVAKKVKQFKSGEECVGQREKRRLWTVNVEGAMVQEGDSLNKLVVDVSDDIGPVVIRNDMEGPSRLSVTCKNLALAITDEDESDENLRVTGKRGGGQIKRISLRKMSKDREIRIVHVSPASDQPRPAAGGPDSESIAKCYLCEVVGGSQTFCQGCHLSIHCCCLMELSISQAAWQDYWLCPSCSDTMAQEALKKAKKELNKAREEAVKSKRRLVDFLSAKRDWSVRSFRADETLVDPDQRTGSSNLGGATKKDCLLRNSEQGVTQDFQAELEVVEGTVPSKIGMRVPLAPSGSSPTLRSSLRQDSPGCAFPTSPRMVMDVAVQQVTPYDIGPARCSASAFDRQEAPSVTSLLKLQNMMSKTKQTSGTGNEKLDGLESPTLKGPSTASGEHDNHTKPDAPNEPIVALQTTQVGNSGAEVGSSSHAHDQEVNIVKPGREDGDGHDGDLGEVYEGNKNNPASKKATEQAVDAGASEIIFSEVPNAAATSSRRHHVYRARGQIPGVRRKSLPWSPTEEDVLKEGVMKFSNDGEWGFQWKRILEFGYGKFHESRTTVDLKDKWRNMVKSAALLSAG